MAGISQSHPPGSQAWWEAHEERLGRRRPRQDGLTVERILAEALDLVDREGLDALTVRALAARFDTSSATLYRHVDSRDELLVLLVDHVLGEIKLPEVVARKMPKRPRAFTVEPEVTLNNSWSNRHTVVEVSGLDRPGLLYGLTQTLSRLNRKAQGKDDTFVLDFVNERDDIFKAFKPYYEATEIGEMPDAHQLYGLQHELEASPVIDTAEVTQFCEIWYRRRREPTAGEHKQLNGILDKAVGLGVNQGGGIAFVKDDMKPTLTEARKRAVADAVARAKTLAEAADIKLE